MAKFSPENRGGQLYLTRRHLAKPPPNLGRPEAKLWRSIIASKQPDWWSPAALQLLQRFVRTSVYAEKLHDALDAEPVGSPAAAELLRQVIGCNGSAGALAAKLRLSVQVSITPRSTGKLAEHGSPSLTDPLIALSAREWRAADRRQ